MWLCAFLTHSLFEMTVIVIAMGLRGVQEPAAGRTGSVRERGARFPERLAEVDAATKVTSDKSADRANGVVAAERGVFDAPYVLHESRSGRYVTICQ
jgi:hypothetical protein